MEVRRITPRGYCYGVVDAMVLTRQAAQNKDLPRPIYILGMIVHNKHVVDALKDDNIITLDGENRLELLAQINQGTVIFTAHGVSPEVRTQAKERGLTIIDATCPDVTRTHDLIRQKVAEGFIIIYVGKRRHPEPEGAIGVAPDSVYLIENEEDIENLTIKTDKILVTNQTTMSQWDTAHLMKKVIEKYPKAEIYNEICSATQERQEAVAQQAKGMDLVIVVGDPRSNNSNRLAQVAEQVAGVKSYRISNVTEIDINWLKGKRCIGVTAGASTPTAITNEVIRFLETFDEKEPVTWKIERTIDITKILPRVGRQVSRRKKE